MDFYILGEGHPDSRERFCCRLAEKAWQQNLRVFLLAPDDTTASRLDDLLWTFRQGSFVPHAASATADGEPILIGPALPPESVGDVLINLARELPGGWKEYERIAEVVTAEPDIRRSARQRFRDYRDAGIEPTSHNLSE